MAAVYLMQSMMQLTSPKQWMSIPSLHIGVWTSRHVIRPKGALVEPNYTTPVRQVYLLQRSEGKLGKTLNKTTGWVHKAAIKQAGVIQIAGASYDKVTNEGLWITIDGKSQLLRVDTVVLCIGQESVNDLMPKLGDTPKSRLSGDWWCQILRSIGR